MDVAAPTGRGLGMNEAILPDPLPAPVIVGAGPAGVRAAQTLVAHGLRPLVIDEAMRAGGQIYRRPPQGFMRAGKALYGMEAGRAARVHAAFDALGANVDYRPGCLVWNAEPGQMDVFDSGSGENLGVDWRDLIIATGATDRVFPVPGWTLPGVYTLGGAQVALKFQGCVIGPRVVFAGTGPLLYLVAYQYLMAGGQVVAVIDNASLAAQISGLPGMLQQPATLFKGAYYVASLLAHGVPVIRNAALQEVLGEDHVTGVRWRSLGGKQEEMTLQCDAVGIGHALRSETQLADVLGCRFVFSDLQQAYVPERDAAGRTSVTGVYVAGDGAGIQGADAAEWAGERAALALLADRGFAVKPERVAFLDERLAGVAKFRRGLEKAFPYPQEWAATLPDETVICRCENITAGELRRMVAVSGVTEINRLKAFTRVGMGRCQGRMCGAAAAELLAAECGIPLAQVGRLRAQIPVKPIPVAMKMSGEVVVEGEE